MQAGEEDDAAPFDLNRTVAYRFSNARPGQADESGPAWLGSAALARFLFFLQICLIIVQIPARFKNL
jgi:hypothetical protein